VNRIDYEATVKAANDAQTSAQIAQNNAAEAAAKASLSNIHDVSSSYHGHGHLDAHGSTKTLTVASPSAPPSSSSGSSSSSHERDSVARSSSASTKSSSAPASSKEAIAANHNYGNNNDFKPSNGPFSYAGY
jgi:hypothetical protein